MATIYYTRIPGTPMTDEQLEQMDRIMKRHNTRRITKEMILEDRQLQAEGRL